jgi:acetylornithine deacetylase
LILALDEEGQRLRAEPQQTALGTGSLTVSIVHGGQGINVVPDSCSVAIDRRVVAGENMAEIRAALADLAGRKCPLPVSVRTLQELPAFLRPPDTPWMRQLAEWSGQEPATAPFGTNAWAYGEVARECVVLGPGSIDQAHGQEEWVAISELEKMAGIYSRWWGVEF